MKLNAMPSAIQLPPKDLQKYTSIKNMLEAERALQPSDLDAIALMVLNMGIMNDALVSIRTDGVVLVSVTAHGQVHKSNPANEVFARANVAVKGLMEQLLMTPKAKALIGSIAEKVEEEDPLTAALKARSKRGK
ncbi:P27 family phage terminase small subunit [Enterovibrio calviensis]|uniref:P27 family phage terminase small subunit n=1 Tax=Enterovibrio calviensis TaxID=91359 RepID=UPI00048926B1|nr:P27 family phage terminase small subunit [Enterovibrio calviensis]